MNESITALMAGLLSFLSPCVLPMIPIFLGSLAANSKNALVSTLVFCAGITSAFCLLGAAASSIGSFLFEHHLIIQIGLGILLMTLSLHSFGVFRIAALDKTIKFESNNSVGLLKSFLMGFTFAFGWSPCVGPILGAILALAANSSSLYKGIGSLAIYSGGMCIPLVVFAVFTEWLNPFKAFVLKHIRWIEITSGVFLFALGIYYVVTSI